MGFSGSKRASCLTGQCCLSKRKAVGGTVTAHEMAGHWFCRCGRKQGAWDGGMNPSLHDHASRRMPGRDTGSRDIRASTAPPTKIFTGRFSIKGHTGDDFQYCRMLPARSLAATGAEEPVRQAASSGLPGCACNGRFLRLPLQRRLPTGTRGSLLSNAAGNF